MEGLPPSVAQRLQALTYNGRAVAYLKVDARLTLVDAGGHLDNYGLAAVRLGEPAVEQALFLEGLLPLVETPYLVRSGRPRRRPRRRSPFPSRRRHRLGCAARRHGRPRRGPPPA